MSAVHPHPWHRGSLFGDGPRRPLDREQRARFKFLLGAHCRSGNLTDKGEKVGIALLKRLGQDGQCDPTHETLAADVRASSGQCHERTARRALDTMRALGLLTWQRRIVRDGWRVEQTSNAYVLVPTAANPPENRIIRTDGLFAHQTRRKDIDSVSRPTFVVPESDRIEALQALARVAAQRRGVLQARLLGKGGVAASA